MTKNIIWIAGFIFMAITVFMVGQSNETIIDYSQPEYTGKIVEKEKTFTELQEENKQILRDLHTDRIEDIKKSSRNVKIYSLIILLILVKIGTFIIWLCFKKKKLYVKLTKKDLSNKNLNRIFKRYKYKMGIVGQKYEGIYMCEKGPDCNICKDLNSK